MVCPSQLCQRHLSCDSFKTECMLLLFQDICVWDLALKLRIFSNSFRTVEMVVNLHDVSILSRSHIYEDWQYHSIVDFLLGVNRDNISFPDICTESSKCHTGICSSGSDLIINVHCSGKSASLVGEFLNNFQFLSIHSDGCFIVRLSRCWLVYNLSLFVLIVRS